MNQLWVYMCSPSLSPLPPPSLSHPSGSSQCTSPEHPVSCNNFLILSLQFNFVLVPLNCNHLSINHYFPSYCPSSGNAGVLFCLFQLNAYSNQLYCVSLRVLDRKVIIYTFLHDISIKLEKIKMIISLYHYEMIHFISYYFSFSQNLLWYYHISPSFLVLLFARFICFLPFMSNTTMS